MYIVHTVVLWNRTFCSKQAVGGGGRGGEEEEAFYSLNWVLYIKTQFISNLV
jgi:hypothetical protein